MFTDVCPTVYLPGHPRGPGGSKQVETIDLSAYTAAVATWMTSAATPPGVREPNTLAIGEFDVDDKPVRAIGRATSDEVETGDEVELISVDELRESKE